MSAYTTASSFLTAPVGTPAPWIRAITAHNPAEAVEIVTAYFTLGAQIGINADLALSQACQECAWFTDWKWTQNRNPAGIGATSRDVPGGVFGSIEDGIKAHYEHLVCYTMSGDPPVMSEWGMLDPRHGFHDGLPTVADLVRPERKWAVPGDGYADAIVAIANGVVGDAPSVPQSGGTVNINGIDVTDLRDQLPTAPQNGPNAAGTTPRQGIIIHYSGVDYPADEDIVTILKNEAQYHINEDWGGGLHGDGLMYHVSVDPQSGQVYLCRDLDAVLWHCAYWGPGGNGSGYAVHVPFGPNGQMSAAGLAGLTAIVNALAQQDGIPTSMVKGHQEVSPTACPGPLMNAFVLPYRAGTLTVAPSDSPPVSSTYRKFSETGHGIDGGFRTWFEGHANPIDDIGFPLSEEFQYQGRTTQVFQRDVVQWFPENKGTTYEFQTMLLGADFAKRVLGLSGPGIP